MRIQGSRERRGAASVELAVLLPFLMFLFVVSVDFGRVFYYSQIVDNCARQGALYACDSKTASHGLYSTLQAAATADASGVSPAPTATQTTGTDSAGNAYVAVTVTWQFKTITSFPWVPTTANISRTVKMRKIS